MDVAATNADGPGQHLSTAALPAALAASRLFQRNFSESWKYSRALGRWLDENVGQYDIVHIHALWSYSSMAAARACRKHQVPYIVRPAGMLSAYSMNLRGLRKRIYWWLMEQATVKGASAIHATSLGEQRDILAVDPDARVHIIPNSLPEEAFTPPAQPPRKTGSHLLFLSRLHPVKGIVDRLLPAIAAVNTPFTLTIAGDEDARSPGYAEAVKRTIGSLGLRDRVNMPGSVTGDQRWALFDKADLFVLPSHSENFGIVIAEAMARGCPYLISRDVQAADFFAKSNAGRVVDSVDELSQAITALLLAPALRIEMGLAGKKFAKQHFHGRNVAAKIVSMYESTISGHHDH